MEETLTHKSSVDETEYRCRTFVIQDKQFHWEQGDHYLLSVRRWNDPDRAEAYFTRSKEFAARFYSDGDAFRMLRSLRKYRDRYPGDFHAVLVSE